MDPYSQQRRYNLEQPRLAKSNHLLWRGLHAIPALLVDREWIYACREHDTELNGHNLWHHKQHYLHRL